MKDQWIFIDESGKPEVFSSKGNNLVEKNLATKYLVLAAVRTENQLKLQQQVTKFRSSLLEDKELSKIFSSAYTLDSFHAQTDYQEVKHKFYDFILELEIKVDVLVVEKLKTYDVLKQKPRKMYGVMTGQLIKNLCHQTENTEIIFSRKDSKLKLKQELEIEVETSKCRRYMARIVRNVKVGSSPEWVVRHLESIGQRSKIRLSQKSPKTKTKLKIKLFP